MQKAKRLILLYTQSQQYAQFQLYATIKQKSQQPLLNFQGGCAFASASFRMRKSRICALASLHATSDSLAIGAFRHFHVSSGHVDCVYQSSSWHFNL